jgi:hypothetical protein
MGPYEHVQRHAKLFVQRAGVVTGQSHHLEDNVAQQGAKWFKQAQRWEKVFRVARISQRSFVVVLLDDSSAVVTFDICLPFGPAVFSHVTARWQTTLERF